MDKRTVQITNSKTAAINDTDAKFCLMDDQAGQECDAVLELIDVVLTIHPPQKGHK